MDRTLEHGARSLLTPRSERKDADDAGTDALLLLRLLDQIAEELEDLRPY